jgi:hypothetical protein
MKLLVNTEIYHMGNSVMLFIRYVLFLNEHVPIYYVLSYFMLIYHLPASKGFKEIQWGR